MLTRESLYVILYSLPVYQMLFYTVQLITLKRANPSRRYLGLMLLVMTIFLIINAVYHLGYEAEMKLLYYIFVPSLLAIPPVFFLYIRSLAKENRDVDSRTRLILFLPPIVILFLNFIIFRALTGAEKLEFLSGGFVPSSAHGNAVQGALLLHWAGMAFLLATQMILAMVSTYRLLSKEMEVMRHQPRHLAYLQLRWIQVLSACVAVFLLAGALMNLFGPARELGPAITFNILMLLCGGMTGYYGMKQDTLLAQVSRMRSADQVEPLPAEENVMDPAGDEIDRIAINIDDDEIKMIIEKLERMMRDEKPYLDPKFSMNDLCVRLEISRRKVTYVINDVLQKNFYGVINDYRIEEAICLLNHDSTVDYKMDAISEMVGFRSKSSFYACFKKYTGVTPSEYRVRMVGEEEDRKIGR